VVLSAATKNRHRAGARRSRVDFFSVGSRCLYGWKAHPTLLLVGGSCAPKPVVPHIVIQPASYANNACCGTTIGVTGTGDHCVARAHRLRLTTAIVVRPPVCDGCEGSS
jgi:hypothetical protein